MTHPARRAERDSDAAQDKKEVARGVHKHEAHMHKGEKETKLKSGGSVHGYEPSERPDRRARGGKVKSKGKGKVIVNINAGGQDDQQKIQAAHQAGIQQGAMLGARAAAARMGPGAGSPPGLPPGPPGGPVAGPPPMAGPPGPMPGAPGMMPPGMPPRRPFAQGGNVAMMRRRDLKGRFMGGAV